MLIVATIALPLIAVRMHYELLILTANAVAALSRYLRARVALAVTLALAAHIAEVIVFGLGWRLLIVAGAVEIAPSAPALVDVIYFSGSIYTTLGFGDIVPVSGGGRLLATVEAVTGLVLIAWTASFTFDQMQRCAGADPDRA